MSADTVGTLIPVAMALFGLTVLAFHFVLQGTEAAVSGAGGGEVS